MCSSTLQKTYYEFYPDILWKYVGCSVVDGFALKLNQLNQYECFQSSRYNGALTHEMPLPKNQSGTQVEVDAGQYGANSSEAVSISSSEQQQPASDDFSLAAHDSPSDIIRDTHNDERNFMPNLGSSHHLDGEMMEPLQAGGNSEVCPSVDVEMSPLSYEMTNFSEVSRVDPQPISEQGACSHSTGTPVQVAGSAEHPSQTVLQHNINAAVVQGPRNIPVHPDHQMATLNSTLPFNADPLHKDLERIHKERQQGTKILEDMVNSNFVLCDSLLLVHYFLKFPF